MQEKWNEICFILSESVNDNITESIFEQKVLLALEKLDWSQYKNELKVKPSIPVGSNNNIKPDIVINCKPNNPEIVVEIKRPSELMENYYDQLKSYMRLLKVELGLLIGHEIHIYYDKNIVDNNEPILLLKIPFNNSSKKGYNFVKLFNKDDFIAKKNNYIVENWVQDYITKNTEKELKSSILSDPVKKDIYNFLRNRFSKYDNQVVSNVLKNINIDIYFSESNLDTDSEKYNNYVNQKEKVANKNLDFQYENNFSKNKFSNAYLLTWNPKYWNWDELNSVIYKVQLGEKAIIKWSCANSKHIRINDRVFIIRLGKEPKGIFASGIVCKEPFESQHWDKSKSNDGKTVTFIKAQIDLISNPELAIKMITLNDLKKRFPNVAWTPQRSGIKIDYKISNEIYNELLNFHNKSI